MTFLCSCPVTDTAHVSAATFSFPPLHSLLTSTDPAAGLPLEARGHLLSPMLCRYHPTSFRRGNCTCPFLSSPKACTAVTFSSSKAPIIKLAAYRILHDNLEENGVNGSYTLHGVNSKSNVQPQSLMLNTHQSFLIHGTFLFAGSS